MGFKTTKRTRKPGDVLLLESSGLEAHLAILSTETDFIHTLIHYGKVVEVPMSEQWAGRIVCVFRYPWSAD